MRTECINALALV